MNQRRLLLISSSYVHGGGYLDYAENEIRDHLSGVRSILFIPFALKDHEAYANKVGTHFETLGYRFESIHRAADSVQAVRSAESVFIGGGNTFRLLHNLYEKNLLVEIRDRANSGMPFMGSSAGTNMACPTLKTTNDMPIVQPKSFEALNLVPFQINPHYLDPMPELKHMGETREQRIFEFLEENDLVVVGLREGGMIRVRNGEHLLTGISGARVFQRNREPLELLPGAVIQIGGRGARSTSNGQ